MQKQQEIYLLSDTVKAEARFRVKTKFKQGKKLGSLFCLTVLYTYQHKKKRELLSLYLNITY